MSRIRKRDEGGEERSCASMRDMEMKSIVSDNTILEPMTHIMNCTNRPAGRSHMLENARMCLHHPVGYSESSSIANETCNKGKGHCTKKILSVHIIQVSTAHYNRVYTCSPHLRTQKNVLYESLNANHQICLANGVPRAYSVVFA